MKYEKSCGAIVYRDEEEREYLVIKQTCGDWTFPKGHVEENETEVMTALREIKEETNIDVLIDDSFREVITYEPEKGIKKDVVFFKAKYLSGEVKIQEAELLDAKWLSYEETFNILTFGDTKEVLKKVVMR